MTIEESLFRATLVTRGRVTGKIHSVILKGIKYNDKIYFSRHRPDSDWFKNIISNSTVVIRYHDSEYSGNAKTVTDETLNKKISQLKFPSEAKADEKRIAIEITLDEQL